MLEHAAFLFKRSLIPVAFVGGFVMWPADAQRVHQRAAETELHSMSAN